MNAKPNSISWHERARTLQFRTQAFIAGRYADAASGATFDCLNPATGKLLARVASGDQEDINRAVSSARAVFREGSWAFFRLADRSGAAELPDRWPSTSPRSSASSASCELL